jgi:fatty-acid desaturase
VRYLTSIILNVQTRDILPVSPRNEISSHYHTNHPRTRSIPSSRKLSRSYHSEFTTSTQNIQESDISTISSSRETSHNKYHTNHPAARWLTILTLVALLFLVFLLRIFLVGLIGLLFIVFFVFVFLFRLIVLISWFCSLIYTDIS